MQALLHRPIAEITAAIRQREVSAHDIVTATLKHMDQANHLLNAVVHKVTEQALSQAKQLDEHLALHGPVGPLHGVPFTVKESIAVAGLPNTQGSLLHQNQIGADDATVVKRLRAAGAILVGKTNVPEFCLGAETENLLYGVTHNPYDLNCTPGGSSGGEAAIVAAGVVPFGIGTDSYGSLRIPAHYCGIATIRPTIGRIPCSQDDNPHEFGIRTGFSARVTTYGPFAHYVEDLDLLLRVMQGADGIDPSARSWPLPDFQQLKIDQLKCAYFIDNGILSVNSETRSAVANAVGVLESLGAQVFAKPPAWMSRVMDLNFALWQAFDLLTPLKMASQQPGLTYSRSFHQAIDTLAKHLHVHAANATIHSAWADWDVFRSEFLQYLWPYDVLICPVLPFSALSHGNSLWDDEHFFGISYCLPFSLVDCSVTVVRIGTHASGLPIGLQIVTKPWQEQLGLCVAEALQQALGGWIAPRDWKNQEISKTL